MKNMKRLIEIARAQGLEPFLHENHKMPMTRRDLIAQGFMKGGGLLMTPGLLSLISARAEAQECGDPASDLGKFRNTPKIMCFEAPGGLSAGANFYTFGQGGIGDLLPTTGYGRMSVSSAWATDQPDVTTFGIPLWPKSGFYLGIMRGTTPEVRANLSGFTACARSGDDSSANPFSPVYWATKAGFQGALTHIVGSEATAHGARSAVPPASMTSSLSSTQISGVEDARNLLEAVAISQALPGRLDKIVTAAAKMSESQLKKFNEKALPAALADLARCNYIKSAKAAGQNLANEVDFTQDPAFLAAINATNDPLINPPIQVFGAAVPFTANANVAQGEEAQLLTMAYLLGKSYAGAGTYVGDGVDYHNNARGTCNQRDFNYGYRLGLYFTTAHYFATRFSIDAGFYAVFYTDGSAGCSDFEARQDNSAQALQGPNPTNDQGESSMMAALGYHRKGRIPIANPRHQINSMNTSGGVDSNNPDGKLIVDSPDVAMKALLQNICVAEGIDPSKVFDALPASYQIWGPKPV